MTHVSAYFHRFFKIVYENSLWHVSAYFLNFSEYLMQTTCSYTKRIKFVFGHRNNLYALIMINTYAISCKLSYLSKHVLLFFVPIGVNI